MNILRTLLNAIFLDSATGKLTLTKSFATMFVALTVFVEIHTTLYSKCDYVLEIILSNLAFVSIALGFRTILVSKSMSMQNCITNNDNNSGTQDTNNNQNTNMV